MTNAWDYTRLAAPTTRPPYAPAAMDRLLTADGPRRAAVIGAGTGHLALELLARGCEVDAVEQDSALRDIGRERTVDSPHAHWHSGTAGLPGARFGLVAFGCSAGLRAFYEACRLLGGHGRVACIRNRRRLDDPLQAEIEALIRSRIPGYIGARPTCQAAAIDASGLFGKAVRFEEPIVHRVPVLDWLASWRSHAGLQRQAGARFYEVVFEIEDLVLRHGIGTIEVPYTTLGWTAETPS
ncbi:hypothetical protein [Nonomuraea typhae]|uniref:Methyltransferase domain-containing protein n=1 Tax=Nonomuraea typhae TaxID=2603600 RepID=A0ABW7YWS0_9ACTN